MVAIQERSELPAGMRCASVRVNDQTGSKSFPEYGPKTTPISGGQCSKGYWLRVSILSVAALAEFAQQVLIAGDQCFLFRPAPAFQFAFATNGPAFRSNGFGVEDGQGRVDGGVSGTLLVLVQGQLLDHIPASTTR